MESAQRGEGTERRRAREAAMRAGFSAFVTAPGSAAVAPIRDAVEAALRSLATSGSTEAATVLATYFSEDDSDA